VAGRSYESSSKLIVDWMPPPEAVDHYTLAAADGVLPPVGATVGGGAVQALLTGLKASTSYTVTLSACLDAACSRTLSAGAPAAGTTRDETWQIRGAGRSYLTASLVVPDGNTKPYAFRYGPGAGAGLEGKVQLYYDPMGQQEKGVKVGTLIQPATDDPDSVSSFAPVFGWGLRQAVTPTALVKDRPHTSQAVPLSAALGGGIRLFFEAVGTDNRGRVMHLDSVDGYTGWDFNPGAATMCNDYSGAGCPPVVDVGVEGDAAGGNPHLRAAMQFKIGYPALTDWRWDGSPGTFMVFTAHLTTPACSATAFNGGYAVWDGARWNVQYDSAGCPKLFPAMQAPTVMHTGGVRYKLYYSHNAMGAVASNAMDASNKPVRLLYADGAATGNPAVVDFEDWESAAVVRDVHYLWPDGSDVALADESKLDDYVVLAPTGDLTLQVMYSNMTDGTAMPFIGMAVLVNP
jgi:hypothetical protein